MACKGDKHDWLANKAFLTIIERMYKGGKLGLRFLNMGKISLHVPKLISMNGQGKTCMTEILLGICCLNI